MNICNCFNISTVYRVQKNTKRVFGCRVFILFPLPSSTHTCQHEMRHLMMGCREEGKEGGRRKRGESLLFPLRLSSLLAVALFLVVTTWV